MAYLPEFDDDVFISYAHLDNDPLTEGQKGWIDNFHRALEVVLRQKLGKDPIIWRDIELGGNDYFADKLVNVIPKVAILVSVLSPGYLNSDWCRKEMHEFCAWAERTGNLRVADKARIFKVLRTFLPVNEHPAEVRSLLGYEFYEMDVVTNRPKEFNPELSEDRAQKFYERVGDLAYDIVQLLRLLRTQLSGQPSAANDESSLTVFLAETTADQRGARDLIRRELLQRGYHVLPDQPFPGTGPELIAAVDDYLKRCRFSVHLVGGRYGLIPEQESRSVVCLQHEAAARRSTEGGLARFIWMPPDLQVTEERQQQFIEQLERDPDAQTGAELIRSPIEEFKTYLEDKLRSARKSPPAPISAPKDEGPPRVYAIFDPQDAEAVRPVINHLFDQGLEIIEPLREGDETQAREDHKENLTTCDAVWIYWGQTGEAWLRAKLRDLQKAKGFGRTSDLLVKAIHVASPETPAKQNFRTHEAEVIRHFAALDPAVLARLAAYLKTAKPGRRG